MNNTIQVSQYAARQTALSQQSISGLIESGKNIAAAMDSAHSRCVHVLYENSKLQGVPFGIFGIDNVGRGHVPVLTAGTKVMLLGTGLPTTAPDFLDESDEFHDENSWSRWASLAKEALRNAALTARRQTTAAARWRVDRLSALQAAFGFTIQDLATVLGITRPQLYKWLDVGNDIKLQEASSARLATVERIAKEWTARSKAPLRSVSKEPLNGGDNVFAMLSVEVISEDAVTAAFDELAGKLQEKPKTRSQRLREAGFTRRPSVRALLSDE